VPAADTLCIILKHHGPIMHPYADYDADRNPAEPFEWEELPSLAGVVLRRHVPSGSFTLAADLVAEARTRLRSEAPRAPVWVETKPADLDPLVPSEPLHDTELAGLAAREIVEPDVFRHFFGTTRC
jgi:hypothetical protein